ncbi:hypothetical protein KKB99_03025, partial [bacterium]|nr:hypothetical protein [bacterium]MBU1024962.1 hypothetical protein [bacterium]
MKTKPIRKSVFLFATAAFLLFMLGCGGVAKNPATPGWNDPKGDLKGGDEKTAQDEKKRGAPEIPPGAGYDVLMSTGSKSLEGGFFKTAAEAYSKAHENKRDAADAALAFVITKITDSPDSLSLLMGPGIDLFYHNTPLIGRWELFPTPLNDDDSYLLRLAALGTKFGTEGKPAAPPSSTPPKAPEKDIPTGTIKTPEGGSKPPGTDGSGMPGAGGEGPLGGQPGSGMDGTRGTQFNRKPAQDLGANPGAGGLQPGGSGEKLEYEGQGQVPQAEFLNLKNDIMPGLIKDYKNLARTYSSGILNLNAVNTSAKSLGTLLDSLIKVLEESLQSAESDDFALELPFKLDTQNALYKVYFNNTDYMIILGYLKILKAELQYRSAYQISSSTDLLFNLPVDKNGDKILTPSEYYPPSPYGELIDGGDEKLQEVGLLFASGLELLVNGFDDLYNDNKLAEYDGNLLIPINIEQKLIDSIAEHRDEFSNFQVLLVAGR